MELESHRTAVDLLSQDDIELLLAQVAEQETKATIHKADGAKIKHPKDAIQPYDFRVPVFLSPTELRKLRMQHDEFIHSLAARLSIYLRLEFLLQMSKLETLTYQKFVDGLSNPTHLTLFRVDPFPGICILDVNPRLGLTIVDRLMGGPGHSVSINRDLSEIEVALLDQAIQIIVGEWCNHWTKLQELRPVLLGHESSGRFLQTSAGDSIMLILAMEARVGDCLEQLQIAFPYTTLEPLIRILSQALDSSAVETAAKESAKPKWNPRFDGVTIPLTAEWPERQLSARQLTELKPGDVLEWDPRAASQVRLRLAGTSKFLGRLGTKNKKWAVEITGLYPSDPS
jgi:flagellar motor switch protein FliM